MIELDWMKETGATASMTLYGSDGWKAGTRYWEEQTSPNSERARAGSLAQVIAEWTEMARAEAEAFAEETVARWRRSSAFEEDVRVNRYAHRAIAAMAVVAVLALVGVAALLWLVVSALT